MSKAIISFWDKVVDKMNLVSVLSMTMSLILGLMLRDMTDNLQQTFLFISWYIVPFMFVFVCYIVLRLITEWIPAIADYFRSKNT